MFHGRDAHATRGLARASGIYAKTSHDPDVAARRLVVADPELNRLLYSRGDVRAADRYAATESNVIGPGHSAWDVARDAYNSPDTYFLLPDGTLTGGNAVDPARIPRGTMIVFKH